LAKSRARQSFIAFSRLDTTTSTFGVGKYWAALMDVWPK
jgi:hypothetical protein